MFSIRLYTALDQDSPMHTAATLTPTPSDAPATAPLRVGLPAPVFRARSTQGELSLADYRGRWLLLFFHPADFTPVCTSEFVALAARHTEFEALGCALLGVSADSVYAHLAWLEDLRRHFGAEVRFPLVEDSGLRIAAAYGLLDPAAGDTGSIRACYVLDPQGIVRALLWYPPQVGRHADELLRLVSALVHSAQQGLSTPAGWAPGKPMLESAPDHAEQIPAEAADRPWYYRERQP